MVRSLSGTLTTAVSSKNRRPYVSCTFEDHINHLGTNVTASNSEAYSDCVIADDGAIIRVRVTRGGNAFQQSAQWQRITDPTVGSQWTTWNTFSGSSTVMFQDGGCAVANNGGGSINAYFQRGDNQKLVNWFSSDGGQTWGGPGDILIPPGAALIKGISAAGNADVFFQYDVVGGDAIGCSFFSGGAWSAIHTWTLAAASSAQGLAVYWDGTKYWIIYSDGYALHEVTASSNGVTWTAFPDIAPSDANGIGRISPRIAKFDSIYNLICVEVDSGFLTGDSWSYPRLRQSADLQHWSSGIIYQDVTVTYGVNLIKDTPPSQSRAKYVLSAMSGIQYQNAYSQSDANNYLDVSSKIIEYKRTDQLDHPGEVEIILDNANSSLTSSTATYGTNYRPIGIFTLINLNEGYYTGSPPTNAESVNTGRYHVQKIIFERAPGVSQIRIIGKDLTSLLDQVNRYQSTYTNATVSWLITEICARAGLLNISVPGTAQMSVNVVIFTLHAGQKYRQAIDELCRLGWLEYFLDQTETIVFKELSGSDPSVWSYTPEIESWQIGTDDIRSNHVVVVGKPPVGGPLGATSQGSAYDTTHVHATNLEKLEVHNDQKLVTQALCTTEASFIMQQEQRDQYAHIIEVPANPALQVLDPITTTDTGQQSIGTSNTSRILKQEVIFIPEKGEYQQLIHLEGV